MTLRLLTAGLTLLLAQSLLLQPKSPDLNRTAPDSFMVQLETSKGTITIQVDRKWAPHGADRFYDLVKAGYYDDARFFRTIKDRWTQFGINGDPAVAKAWRNETIPDDPHVLANGRGTVAYAFAVPNGRTTQVFISLRDNSDPFDGQGFIPFGKVVSGMDVADALYSGYGETSGGGIRAGKQDSVFEGGNAFLKREFPQLDYIVRAAVRTTRPVRELPRGIELAAWMTDRSADRANDR